ncbi:MAG: aminodeoxychorismate/anthranilate synthase component II [Candidatus Marinimicrobia bacterium]|nr:aminodeoxychorismate/anthranilate synthase component II [Candidatus Neomarinimicrobiota bacterium]
MILLIDNYDSFTYNLYQQIASLGGDLLVVKNDELSIDEIYKLHPEKIIISPGPKTPADSGICIPLIKSLYDSLPILGVCLGHQCLGVAFGQNIIPAKTLVFGKTSPITRTHSRILHGLPLRFDSARYHSLVIDQAPVGFDVTSLDDSGDIMSMEHQSLPLFGVQFHPESFLMHKHGDMIIQNFLDI